MPRFVAATAAIAYRAQVRDRRSIAPRKRNASSSTGVYSRRAPRTTPGLFLLAALRAARGWQERGISVSDSTSEPSNAKIIVSAMGRNSFPSTPSSVRMGRNTIMMMSSPNIVGLRTSIAASRMVSSHGLSVRFAACRTQFSIMITELSTIRPKSMAPRLSRLAAMAGLNHELRPQRPSRAGSRQPRLARRAGSRGKANRTLTTSSAPATRLCLTVSITLSTRCVRS